MIKLDLRTFVKIYRLVFLVNGGCLVGFIFLGRVPQLVALLIIGGWILTMLLTVAWGLAIFFRKVSFLCPECSAEGYIQTGEGFVCPKCGPIKCHGWLTIQCDRNEKNRNKKRAG
ncbi:MAG TPA: hypothetical protein VK815_06300 [Candidatus Acidoferrales bacterium]|nr:hypothetical protein [Candidatus Acidoferrales bacterium]